MGLAHPDSPTFDRGRSYTLRSRGSVPGPVGPSRRKRYRDPVTGGGGERPTVVIANRLIETPVFQDMNMGTVGLANFGVTQSRGSSRRGASCRPPGRSCRTSPRMRRKSSGSSG